MEHGGSVEVVGEWWQVWYLPSPFRWLLFRLQSPWRWLPTRYSSYYHDIFKSFNFKSTKPFNLWSLLVWGVCSHCFHMHCIMKWLSSQQQNQICPMCRQDWALKSEWCLFNDQFDIYTSMCSQLWHFLCSLSLSAILLNKWIRLAESDFLKYLSVQRLHYHSHQQNVYQQRKSNPQLNAQLTSFQSIKNHKQHRKQKWNI